ncbi:hypothetical protein RB213_008563 [Colletotrichum asianum]
MACMTATIESIVEWLSHLGEADLSERQQLLDTVLQTLLNNAVSWCSLLVMDIALLRDLDAKLRDPAQRIRAFREFTNCLMFVEQLVWWWF